ncbi:MAG: hypothetical protein ABI557_15690 [Aureliella sp.]
MTQPTRLEGLIERWSTKSAAKFRFRKFRAHEEALRLGSSLNSSEAVKEAGEEADFNLYETEDQSYRGLVQRMREKLAFDLPVVVEKQHLPNFMFMRAMAVVVLGQDGLVANTAKYADELPIIGVNPDPQRNDGVLLPFTADTAAGAVRRALDGTLKTREVTLAEVQLNDGRQMPAFNDFFIGRSGHASARYTLRTGAEAEPQSSSGILVCTGVGSSGWMSSVFNMTRSIAGNCGTQFDRPTSPTWEERRLDWVVREPFISRHSSADLVFGSLQATDELVVESLMPERGVIFSDGIEQDFLEFNSGTIARISVADRRANLAVRV